VFGNAFIQTLITKTAIIDQLFSKHIVLHDTGIFQTEGFEAGVNGVRITAETGLIEAVGGIFNDGIFNNITIKNRHSESYIINNGSLIYNKSGYSTESIIITPGWYLIDIAAGGGGNGARSSYGAGAGNGIGQSGGRIKTIINIVYDCVCFLYIGERGKNAIAPTGGAAGRGHELELFGAGKSGPTGGLGGSNGTNPLHGGDGGKGSSWNRSNATAGSNGGEMNGYGTIYGYHGGGGGGGGNTILYIPHSGLLFACSGGSGGGGESGSLGGNPGKASDGSRGSNSFDNNLGDLSSLEGYIKIYKAPLI
jgi:hypothetical protein